ncbi:MAG: hypothetical protein MHPSP_003170 [Paramarteilia canceri]
MNNNEIVQKNLPTQGFFNTQLTINGVNFSIFDVGGQKIYRDWWKEFLTGANAMIFVVDSADHSRMTEASEALHGLINDSSMDSNSVIAIMANKQDMEESLKKAEISSRLELHKIPSTHKVEVFETVATSGHGIYDMFDFIKKKLS